MSTTPLHQQIQREAYKIVLYQGLGVAIIATIITLLKGSHAGYSALMGGLAYSLPNLIFVWRVFRFAGASQMVAFMRAFFLGEMLKLIFSAILFLVIEKYLEVSLLSELTGFIGAIIAFWIACMWHFTRKGAAR